MPSQMSISPPSSSIVTLLSVHSAGQTVCTFGARLAAITFKSRGTGGKGGRTRATVREVKRIDHIQRTEWVRSVRHELDAVAAEGGVCGTVRDIVYLDDGIACCVDVGQIRGYSIWSIQVAAEKRTSVSIRCRNEGRAGM